ncbi:unnamed protein product [Leptosia nina]|uniref:Uncharacterized protein n=1 Tax=Leptosia nina TaxID=320188 RepID=A0AAV1JTX0_9NEOP
MHYDLIISPPRAIRANPKRRKAGWLCAGASGRALEHAPRVERPRAGTRLPPRRIQKIPTDTALNIRSRIKNAKMQIYAVRSSRVLSGARRFHQMQSASNYHTQVAG